MDQLEKCPGCGGDVLNRVGVSHDFLVSNCGFGIEKCGSCNLVFTNPRPELDKLADYYLSLDYISHTDSQRGWFERLYITIRKYMINRKVRLIQRHVGGNKAFELLDFGCATGEFLLSVKYNKGLVWGVEPNAGARKKATGKGLGVVENIEHLNKTGFDVITLWHVFEHIPDVKRHIRMFRNLLKKDGLIFVAVPDHKSFDSSFYGMEWAAWDVPRHLYHFEESTLRSLFQTDGFTFVEKHGLIFDSFYVALLTEKNKKSGFWGLIRAFAIGAVSLVLACFRLRAWSSHVIVFRKN